MKVICCIKLSNEKLFLNSNSKKVQCHIIGLFNIYGDEDNFQFTKNY